MRLIRTLLPVYAFTLAAALQASPLYVVAYGDSLSDNGNIYAVSGFPPPPYYNGRLSNGPVAVENLADQLGATLLDFAWGGATTGLGNTGDNGTPTSVGIFGLPGMAPLFSASLPTVTPIASNSLFVVWGGADDFISPSPLDATPFAVADRAVSNLIAMAAALQAIGAQSILVPGLPDLGLTPRSLAAGPVASAQASAVTDYFNNSLRTRLPAGVAYYDTAGLMRAIVADPARFGLVNVTSPCLSATPCANPDQYLFWDDIHPTAATHRIVAAEFAEAVPEPATWILLASAGVLAAIRRRACTR